MSDDPPSPEFSPIRRCDTVNLNPFRTGFALSMGLEVRGVGLTLDATRYYYYYLVVSLSTKYCCYVPFHGKRIFLFVLLKRFAKYFSSILHYFQTIFVVEHSFVLFPPRLCSSVSSTQLLEQPFLLNLLLLFERCVSLLVLLIW